VLNLVQYYDVYTDPDEFLKGIAYNLLVNLKTFRKLKSDGSKENSDETPGSVNAEDDESEKLTQPILLQPRVEVVPLPANFDKQFSTAPALKRKRGRPLKMDSQTKLRSS